jgi:hypothetical protein
MKKNLIVDVGIIAVLVAVSFSALSFWKKTAPQQVVSIAQTPTPAAPRPTVAEPSLASRIKLATVRKGEGPEHPLVRRLMNEPQFITDPKEAFEGDPADKIALKRWAGWETDRLAVKFGLKDWKFGGELRITKPDVVAFMLQKDADGNVLLAEYEVTSDGEFGTSPQPTNTIQIASSISQSQFLGMPDFITAHPLPQYEYQYIPG